jgi:hypothetical protein
MTWLRPTRLTWLLLPLPLLAWLGLVAINRDAAALFGLLLAVELPFRLWGALGVTMGRRADFYGWPMPGPLGWTLIALTHGVVWYVAASAVAAAVRAARRPRPPGH